MATATTAFENLVLDVQGGIARVTIHRPKVLNALNDLGGAVPVDRDRRFRAGAAGVVPDGRAHPDPAAKLGM